MDSMKTIVSSKQLLLNLMILKQQMRRPLPSDVILYQCKNCHMDLPLNYHGILEIDKAVEETMGRVLDDIVANFIQKHVNINQQCSSMIELHPEGLPKNLLISIPESDEINIKKFQIANKSYKVKLIIKKEAVEEKVLFALYQLETFLENTYAEFIECNFNTFLNIGIEESLDEELIYDDESANLYQHLLPRTSGGGRKLNASYNYECIWCPKEVIRLGKKGRFRELRSYREHFRAYHHSEDGIGVPMVDFLEKVQRVEPTWFCTLCKQHYSLGNRTRHKAICKPDHVSSDSEQENYETPLDFKKKNIQRAKKISVIKRKKNFCIYDTSSDENEDFISKEGTEREETNKSINSEETLNKDPNDIIPEPEENSKNKCKKNVKAVNIDYTYVDIGDEMYCSSNENDSQKEICEPKIEPNEVQLELEVYVKSEAKNSEESKNRWWLKVPKHLYGDRGTGGPQIFLPSDTEEFVMRCNERYISHKKAKMELDKKMKEAESHDAQLLQFSDIRDKPILEKYTTFVKTSSAKDILHIFSEEYEQLDLPTGAKSSTAGQYTNRIMEFFKFMAKRYENFHLDWLLDYKGSIEKTYPDGNKNSDIFLPTKEDLTDFIKQFKYGGKTYDCIF